VETISLLEQKNIDFKKIGKHGGKTKMGKLLAFAQRNLNLMINIPEFDISISSNYEAPQVSWLKKKISIVFDDNDISPNWLYSKFANFIICPGAIDRGKMISQGIQPDKLITYSGYKEDIYIAGFKPDPEFPKKIPFKDFITLRPENLYASYVTKGSRSIIPELVRKLSEKGYNILYLPRYEIDRDYVRKQDNIFIPGQPLNGLDVCYYSSAVLTGAGTFSREASLMGIPAVSFYAGNDFLSVDKHLMKEERIFFSRNPDEIVEFLSSSKKSNPDFSNSMKVRNEVFGIVDKIIDI
jgi:predicted glycosyltransferase